jgi:biopolymer transport protein ExbD
MSSSQKQTIEQSDTQHFEPPRKQRSSGGGKQQPPLTPMIDVTFQLLIFFLLTSSFQLDEGQIPGSIPAQGPSSPSIIEPVNVTLRPAGTYFEEVQYKVDQLPPMTRPQELQEILLSKKAAYPEGQEIPVILDVSRDVRWSYVTEAFNAASLAKFPVITFKTR